VNGGYGYHSNDARGTTIMRDAVGVSADRVTPLVRASGAEAGIRTVAVRHLQSTVAVWTLHLESELVFAGDAGSTKMSRPSRRYGVEWANYYSPRPWLMFDGDVAWSRGRFTNVDSVGDRIPGSVQTVVSLGATLDSLCGAFGSARLRYFGPRPLIESGSVQSGATSLVNLEAGYKISKNVRLALDVFNLLNARDSDIDYYYGSRLHGEPAGGVNDIHFHPMLPRTARVNLSVAF
jgi:outer membrane receptor protein involved in Fe transport